MTATTTADRGRGLSLETRIFLVTSLLIALLVGGAVAVTSVLLRRIARGAALDSLRSSAAAQAAFQDQRYRQLLLISRLFAADPDLSAYLSEAAATRDTRSILDLLSERRNDCKYDFAIVLDPQGRVIARTDQPQGAGQDLSKRALVADGAGRDNREAAGVWREGNDLYYAVAVPVVKDFTPFGYLITGFQITDQAEGVREMREISGADVAFVANGGRRGAAHRGHHPAEGTARSLARASLATAGAMETDAAGTGACRRAELTIKAASPGSPWRSPLRDAGGTRSGATVALASVTRELAAYRQIQARAARRRAGGGSSSRPLLAFAFARRALAPVRQLAAAAEAARQGNYDQQIDSDRSDEVGRLAHTFHELLADLREKRDMEEYVNELSRNLRSRGARGLVGGRRAGTCCCSASSCAATPAPAPAPTAGDLAELAAGPQAGHRGDRPRARPGGGHRGAPGAGPLRRGEPGAAGARRESARVIGAATGRDPAGGREAPVVALAAGRAVTGPVTVGERAERALVGLPVQQIESLLREATPGEILLSREVHEELKGAFEAGRLPAGPRRGVISAAAALRGRPAMASQLTGVDGRGPATAGGDARPSPAAATLSGISPGALHGAALRDPLGARRRRHGRSSTRRATASSTTWSPSRC